MQDIKDFTNSQIVPRQLGGYGKKIRIVFDNKYYILKFRNESLKRCDVETSHTGAISEYICSHIFQSVGIDTQNTILGLYNDEICVACEDFRESYEDNIEFAEFARTIYRQDEFEESPQIEQLYEVYECDSFPQNLKDKAVERFWDTFVIDALVGNSNRDASNWGFLVNNLNNSYKLAPVYDLKNTQLSLFSSEKEISMINDDFRILQKVFAYPYPASPNKSCRWLGYYDVLASNFDENCSKALIRIFPKINMNKVFSIVDNTPFISETKKVFYKKLLQVRYETILEKAYNCCITQNYDKDAQYRVQNEISIDDPILKKMMADNFFSNVSCLNQNAEQDAEYDLS